MMVDDTPHTEDATYSAPIARKRKKESVPWALWIALILSVVIFWVVPFLQGPQHVQVEFVGSAGEQSR